MGEAVRYAISYSRFSHERQAKGSTIERQEKALNDYLARNPDVHLVQHLSDDGVSSFRGKHAREGALSRIIAGLEQGDFPRPLILIVESLDRLSREPFMDAFDRFSTILKHDCTIAICDMNQDLSRESLKKEPNRIWEIIGAMNRAHGESARKSDLVTSAWRSRIKLALKTGCAIKGYLGPPWVSIDPVTNRYVVGLDELRVVETVNLIFEWRADGVNDHSIAKRLNEQRREVFRASVGKDHKRQGWYQSYISKLLQNRQVLGEMTIRGVEMPKGYIPEIITPELFHRAQAARSPREGKPGRKGLTLSNLFTGVAKCSHCGGTMEMTRNRAQTQDGPAPIKFLMCSSRKRRFKCESQGMINYEKLESAVLGFLSKIPWTEIVKAENPDNPLPAIEDAIARTEIEIAALTEQRDRAIAMILKEAGFEEEFGPVIDRLRPVLRDAQARLSDLKADSNREAHAWRARPGLINNAIEFFEKMNIASDAERLVIRNRLADALAQMITQMKCDTSAKRTKIEVGNYWFSVETPNRSHVTTRGGFGENAALLHQKQTAASRL
ncbi:recombinase family protein [Methylobacterium sp. Leaf466]|uniref:recombinase family protein n=1 Tax=Methylobacterium sp. Leaf466 TaxID=1736386 RepID=UPI0006FBDD9A|nr:recombinase family protein [Methylobacterium sp. Leaf466]KQT90364.1 hypothetical protein ASG59_00740 [Methylobacterium sp. Leaf466]